jgi:ribosomal protein S18 acetylase RimI-like enzyme
VFERFTDNARRVIVLAQEESRLLNHNYIGTEHILLGMLSEGRTTAGKALASLRITLEAARRQVREIVGEGDAAPSAHIPFTPRVKKVLELALREALERGQHFVGTEHLLLGLIREGNGVAVMVLQELGADADPIRRAVVRTLEGRETPDDAPRPAVRLRPMRADEWDAWRSWAVGTYADDVMRNEALTTRERAMAQAEEEFDALLTDGVGTPEHHVLVAEDADSGERVGHLWFGPRARNPDRTVAWLFDIFVEEANRGRGIGRMLMKLLESEAHATGIRRIELNVFGDNDHAKHLYESMEYVEMARQLGKDLSSSDSD